MSGVLITGLGVVSPLGHDLEQFWTGLLKAEQRVRPLSWPGSDVNVAPAYLVEEDPLDTPAEWGRASRFALAAGRAALIDAGLFSADGSGQPLAEIGICLGLGNGDSDLVEAARDGRAKPSGLSWFPYGTAGLLARELGLTGPNMAVANACSASAYAVSFGADAISAGLAEVMLVGGTEAVSRTAMGSFVRLGAVDPLHCRPFDAERKGTVYGEGAAFLVLESEEHAARRFRRGYARVLAAGWSCDAYHATAPEPTGAQAVSAAEDTLARAGAGADEIGAVVCHGTGTPLNDRAESRTLTRVLGQRTAAVPATAVKSTLGHSGGAAGAFSCLTAVLVADTGEVPPTANLTTVDPECALNIVQGGPATTEQRTVLVNAYAFGGNNISVLISADQPLDCEAA